MTERTFIKIRENGKISCFSTERPMGFVRQIKFAKKFYRHCSVLMGGHVAEQSMSGMTM